MGSCKHSSLQSAEARLLNGIRRPCCSEMDQKVLPSLEAEETKLVWPSAGGHESAVWVRKNSLPLP